MAAGSAASQKLDEIASALLRGGAGKDLGGRSLQRKDS